LYDLENDPHETHNLATDRAFAEVLAEYRAILEDWISKTGDQGQTDESVDLLKGVLEQWADQAVNPEYDKARS
ncbi:MAG: sulfatase family protein, partial [Bythopirellula sp.]